MIDMKCTKVLNHEKDWIKCERPIKNIGFWKHDDNIFRLACEEHREGGS
tara:strand:- start:7836 stop:7982 length:147 start_codon:yes stop_codon:yes gene_type:complete